MEVNLLNPTGIHKRDSGNFADIDKSFISDVASLNNDFESAHTVNKKVFIKKSQKKKLFFLCFFTALIVGLSIYYKFFVNQKTFVESQKLQTLIYYVMDTDNLNLLNFNFENYSIDLRFEMNFDKKLPKDLKKNINELFTSPDKYEVGIAKHKDMQIISIKHPPFLEVINSRFDKNLNFKNQSIDDKLNLSAQALKIFIDSIFNINKYKISNFNISRSNFNQYNIKFPK